MTQLGMVENDEYWPEFGTLVVRDSGQPATLSGSLLDEHATDTQPCGRPHRTPRDGPDSPG